MAKIVLAGVANCPYYARVELIADRLSQNLPGFQLHKIVKLPEEWKDWVSLECQSRGWSHTKSPLIWRELVNRGGKGILIGGANEFQDYVSDHYGILSDLKTEDMTKIAEENYRQKKEIDEEERERISAIKPIRVCITSASSSSAYGVIAALSNASVFGSQTDMAFHLYDDECESALHGTAMEVADSALPLVRDARVFCDIDRALVDCHVVVLLDVVPRNNEESGDDWLRRNFEHFMKYAAAFERLQNPDLKVVVAGRGPINFVANMLIHNTSVLCHSNVVAVSRLAENRAKGVLSERLGVNSALIADLLVWGSVNGTHVYEVTWSRIYEHEGAIWGPRPFSVSLREMVHDDAWLETKFGGIVDRRCALEEGSLRHQASMALGDSIASLLKNWWMGSNNGEMHSMAVASQGWYDVPDGLVFSFPVKFIRPGEYVVIDDLQISDEIRSRIQDIVDELESEVEVIFPNPNRKPRKHVEFIIPPESVSPFGEAAKFLNGDDNNLITDSERQNEEDDAEKDENSALDKILEDDELAEEKVEENSEDDENENHSTKEIKEDEDSDEDQ